ncbi:MAG TPA: class I SAM-dependent methyltransferase [Candidatus Sulfotelmatobacter sp.]|nr:class I SAM-dependent methyltransferase [Candidatus Sulfotelmatobacter sp.]
MTYAADPLSLGVPEDVRAILRCPTCHGTLDSQSEGFSCRTCGKSFPQTGGLTRFVDAQYYAQSFGFQWHRYADSRWDQESDITFARKTGFSPKDMAGKLVLDVGCGTGRFVDVVTRYGARTVGIDLSAAAEVAARNLKDRELATIFQADVFNLPFAPESFDFIYSIGVLHHTPDCEKAFKTLTTFLKPGGQIAIWLYSAYNKWYRFSDIYRKVTSRMSARSLHALCQLAGPFYYIHRGLRRIPLVGRPISAGIKTVLPLTLDDPNWDYRVLATFDWYSPKYQSKHTYEEVFGWFESCGLVDLHVIGPPVAVRGRKPRS